MTDRVSIREVGPRDGLQNEKSLVSTESKIKLIERLCEAGVDEIEVTAFVKLPQFHDNQKIAAETQKLKQRFPQTHFSALVPNQRGYDKFIEHPLDEVCFFIGASETFNQKNVGCSISEHLSRFQPVLSTIQRDKSATLAYLSTVCGCPYEGDVALAAVVDLAKKLFQSGFDRLSLGDTIGVGRPKQITELIEAIAKVFPIEKIAWHGHNTYGRAVVNAYAAYQAGIHVFDSSIGGLGGCPYAPGAKGNLATEDLVDLFESTNADLSLLLKISDWLQKEVLPHRQIESELYQANKDKLS
jgi:hydroxymethylglutaryl-CoA lyase